ncbi:MAG: acylglycerol lipase [Verrucomicrobiales bacterium]|jgi:acylglycerol lipase
MKVFEETIEVEGGPRGIHRYRFEPEIARPKGGVIMVHGIGDHLGRYRHVAEFFCDRGFSCTGVDLPGHGKSAGQRGHIPTIETITDLVDLALFQFAETLPESAPIGIFAHSMGAFVVLEHLARRQPLLRFAWLSSPLVSPSEGRNSLLVSFAKRFAWLFARLSINTGVSTADCHPTTDAKTGAAVPRDPLKHRRISFGFAGEVMRQEALARAAVRELTGDLELMITHGDRDQICGYDLSKELFDSIPLRRKRFVTAEGALHETLHGPEAAWTLGQAAEWLEEWNPVKPETTSSVES